MVKICGHWQWRNPDSLALLSLLHEKDDGTSFLGGKTDYPIDRRDPSHMDFIACFDAIEFLDDKKRGGLWIGPSFLKTVSSYGFDPTPPTYEKKVTLPSTEGDKADGTLFIGQHLDFFDHREALNERMAKKAIRIKSRELARACNYCSTCSLITWAALLHTAETEIKRTNFLIYIKHVSVSGRGKLKNAEEVMQKLIDDAEKDHD